MVDFKVGLGSKVRDKITGYIGIVTGRTEWLYGCRRYTVQSQELKDGKPPEALCVDEDAMQVLEPVGIPVKEKIGGPRADAKPRSDMKR